VPIDGHGILVVEMAHRLPLLRRGRQQDIQDILIFLASSLEWRAPSLPDSAVRTGASLVRPVRTFSVLRLDRIASACCRKRHRKGFLRCNEEAGDAVVTCAGAFVGGCDGALLPSLTFVRASESVSTSESVSVLAVAIAESSVLRLGRGSTAGEDQPAGSCGGRPGGRPAGGRGRTAGEELPAGSCGGRPAGGNDRLAIVAMIPGSSATSLLQN